MGVGHEASGLPEHSEIGFSVPWTLLGSSTLFRKNYPIRRASNRLVNQM